MRWVLRHPPFFLPTFKQTPPKKNYYKNCD
nr:MAG TPA: hypothetical protein [Caudoviricetes sp.]